MRLTWVVAVIVVFCPTPGSADSSTIESTARELAIDLANIQQDLDRARTQPIISGHAWGKTPLVLEVTADHAVVRAGADDKAPRVLTPKRGQLFNVVDRNGNWYAVVPKVQDEVLDPKESGWIKANDARLFPVIVENGGRSTKPSTTADDLYDRLQRKVLDLRQKYRNNPHILIRGFSIELGMVPSVSLAFEFKDQ